MGWFKVPLKQKQILHIVKASKVKKNKTNTHISSSKKSSKNNNSIQ